MADDLRDVFNQIAPSWYNYRHHTIFRRELEKVASRWHSGRLLNIGCGHGADFLPFTGNFELHGIDFSEEMIKLARKYSEKFKFEVNLAVADALTLPYQQASFDQIIAVATYHHLTNEQRLPAFLELKRVLKPGGEAFITVWNRWQPRFWSSRHEVHVPWRSKDKVFYRYYNLFSYGEIIKLVKSAGLEIIEGVFQSPSSSLPKFFSRNICLIVKRRENEA